MHQDEDRHEENRDQHERQPRHRGRRDRAESLARNPPTAPRLIATKRSSSPRRFQRTNARLDANAGDAVSAAELTARCGRSPCRRGRPARRKSPAGCRARRARRMRTRRSATHSARRGSAARCRAPSRETAPKRDRRSQTRAIGATKPISSASGGVRGGAMNAPLRAEHEHGGEPCGEHDHERRPAARPADG